MNSHLRTLLPVLLLSVTVSHAHLGDIIYPIYELPTADLPDLHSHPRSHGRAPGW